MNAPSNRIAPPPRAISFKLAAQMFLGGAGAQVGWAVLGFGSIFFWAFAWHADLSGWRFREGAVSRAQGEVLNCRKTSYSVDEADVYANEYHFKVGDASIGGVSYDMENCVEGPVTVEYLTAAPEVSRIAGMRRDVMGPWATLVAIFPAVGLLLVVAGLRKGARRVHLLREGVPAPGHITEQKATAIETNGRRDYRVTLAFTAHDGRKESVTIRTNRPEDYGKEWNSLVLHDASDPKRAMLVGSLPGKIGLDDAGSFVGGTRIAIFILPVVSLALNGWLFWLNS
jgi:hypothetical protein